MLFQIKSTSALPLREALNQSGTDPDTSLDLSMKEIYAIIYYPDSDPGQEYDIRNSKELLDWSEMKKGDTVQVKFGYAKMQGTVVSVSGKIHSDVAIFSSYTITESFLKPFTVEFVEILLEVNDKDEFKITKLVRPPLVTEF